MQQGAKRAATPVINAATIDVTISNCINVREKNLSPPVSAVFQAKTKRQTADHSPDGAGQSSDQQSREIVADETCVEQENAQRIPMKLLQRRITQQLPPEKTQNKSRC